MVWLTTVKGVPIGAWHMKIGQEGIYNLHTKGTLEIAKNGLMQCSIAREAWNNFKDFRVKSFLVPKYSLWEEILLGSSTNLIMNQWMKKQNGMLVNHVSSQ